MTDLCGRGIIGDAVDTLLRDLDFQGAWTCARCTMLSAKLRRFAELYTIEGSSVHAAFLDAAQCALTARVDKGYAAVAAYRVTPQLLDPRALLVEAVHVGDLDMARTAVGADVNTADFNGTTPLMLAAHYHDQDMVQWLIACGANTNATDIFGENYKHYENPGIVS